MPPAPPWPIGARVLFRFALAYVVLYILPFPLDLALGERASKPWDVLVQWAGHHVPGLPAPIPFEETGSGDRTWDYVRILCAATLAAAAAAVWSLLALRRPSGHPRLLEWLRVLVRFYLGTMMIAYGSFKLVPSQFPAMPLDKLLQRYGESSPMGLLWNFMGHSPAYQSFTGAAEALAGALLLFRRTTLPGALLSVAVLAHVVLLNFCFDVPVKQFSCHLLAMALFLLLPDLRRLADVLLLHRAVPAAQPQPLFPGRRWRVAARVLASAVLVLSFGGFLTISYVAYTDHGRGAPRSPLRGVWSVEEFSMDEAARPPLLTDADRWSHVTFDGPRFVVIRDMRDRRHFYSVRHDEAARTLTLAGRSETGPELALSYERPDSATLLITGDVNGHPLRARLRRRDESDFLLTSRGFRWVNESPDNR